MDQLIREGNPPAGQLASPVPQVWDPTANGGAGGWVRVYGEHHASRAILYGPNGQPISTANRLPVEATLSGRTAVLTTLVSAQAITDTEIRNVTFDASPYRQIDFVVRNSLDSEVAIGFRILDTTWFYIIDDDGTPRPYMPNPAQPEYRWHRVPTRSATGTSRYFMLSQIPLNDGKFKAPFRDYRFTADILYRAVNTPTAGSLSIILVGVPN